MDTPGPDRGSPAEQLALLRSLLDGASDHAIVAVGPDGAIRSWNDGAKRMYGYEETEVVGLADASILHPPQDEGRHRLREITTQAAAGGRWAGEAKQLRKDGTAFIAHLTLSPRVDAHGEPSGFALVARLLTDQERASSEHEYRNRMMREELRVKSRFLADMSHALRAPLNSIIGFSQLMHSGKAGPMAAPHLEHLGDILTSSRRLQQVINDVLDIARIDAGDLELSAQEIDLRALATEAKELLTTLSARKRLDVSLEVDVRLGAVIGDRSKLKQVLYTFLSNAIGFTPESGAVAIRMKAWADGRYRIEVQDSGIGLSPTDAARVFLGFQKLGPASGPRGSGLGLALVKHTVQAMGGTVGVASATGRGCVFHATLPRAGAMIANPDPAQSPIGTDPAGDQHPSSN